MNIMRYKLLYFLFSLLLILPGIFFLITSGLKLGIDFSGGSLLEYQFSQNIDSEILKSFFAKNNIEIHQINKSDEISFIIKLKPLEQEEINNIGALLKKQYPDILERRIEIVGPVIGGETTKKAIIAVIMASLTIVLYIAFSFRKVPKPTSSFRFGLAAVVALLHDVLMVLGMFAIFGHFFHTEVDILFVTAVLTIIGFSVHDTIVVFDRIKENLLKFPGQKFEKVANISILQTLGRSLNTSLTVVFVLTSMILFGGETLKWFSIALLIGIVSGTYSSIFNATAFLVWWEEKLGN